MITTNKVKSYIEIVKHGLTLTKAHYPETCNADKNEAVCSCYEGQECKSPGKHPVLVGWNSDPNVQLSDECRVEKVWDERPEYNAIAITGLEVGGRYLGVLDIDDLSELQALLDHSDVRLPETAVAETGRLEGGLHFYLKFRNIPPSTDSIEVEGKRFQIEVKGLGKGVMAPGSIHFTGNQYVWFEGLSIREVGIADAPEWLEQALSEASRSEDETSGSRKRESGELVQKIFEDGLSEGERNDTLFRYVCSLKARDFSWKETEGHLRAANGIATSPLEDKELESILKSAGRYFDGKPKVTSYQSRLHQAREKVEFIVDRMIPVGLSLIAGGKSVGKSQLGIDAALAVATGSPCLGHFPVVEGPVLYLDLEGNKDAFDERVEQRMKGSVPKHTLSTVHLTDIALDVDFLTWFEDVLDDLPDVRFVIIDTLGDVIRVSGRGNAYLNEKKALIPLHQIALQRKIALLVLHHTRQGIAADDVEQISGTSGLVANCDVWGVLRRPRKRTLGTLIVGGKVIKGVEIQYALEFDKETGSWSYKGLAEDVVGNQRHQLILSILEEEDESLAPKEIKGLLEGLYDEEVKDGTLYSDLHRLRKAGKITGRRKIRILKSRKDSGSTPSNDKKDNDESSES